MIILNIFSLFFSLFFSSSSLFVFVFVFFDRSIARGSYGSVSRGKWGTFDVAIKEIYPTIESININESTGEIMDTSIFDNKEMECLMLMRHRHLGECQATKIKPTVKPFTIFCFVCGLFTILFYCTSYSRIYMIVPVAHATFNISCFHLEIIISHLFHSFYSIFVVVVVCTNSN